MGKKTVNLILLMACMLSIPALMPNVVMAEDVLPHHPTLGTGVIVVTDIEGRGVVNNVTNELEGAGYAVSYYDPNNSTVVNLRTCLHAGVIVWVGHGTHLGQVILRTSEWAYTNQTHEDEAIELYLKYKEDFDNGRVVWRNVTIPDPTEPFIICWVYITPSFISYYYTGDMAFPNSLWYTCSCSSLKDNSMALAFLESGGAAYMGWTREVSIPYGNQASKEMINKLSNGYTVDEVVSEGYEDPNSPHATLVYEGDGAFRILLNLVVQVPQAPDGVTVWVDGRVYTSPVNIWVGMGQHTIEVQKNFLKEAWMPGYYYVYTFDHWSDGSEDNPRTVYLTEDATFTACYVRSRIPWG